MFTPDDQPWTLDRYLHSRWGAELLDKIEGNEFEPTEDESLQNASAQALSAGLLLTKFASFEERYTYAREVEKVILARIGSIPLEAVITIEIHDAFTLMEMLQDIFQKYEQSRQQGSTGV